MTLENKYKLFSLEEDEDKMSINFEDVKVELIGFDNVRDLADFTKEEIENGFSHIVFEPKMFTEEEVNEFIKLFDKYLCDSFNFNNDPCEYDPDIPTEKIELEPKTTTNSEYSEPPPDNVGRDYCWWCNRHTVDKDLFSTTYKYCEYCKK